MTKLESIKSRIRNEIIERENELYAMVADFYTNTVWALDEINFYVEIKKENEISFGFSINKELKENQIEFLIYKRDLLRLEQFYGRQCIIDDMLEEAEEDKKFNVLETDDFELFVKYIQESNTPEKIEDIYRRWTEDDEPTEKPIDFALQAYDKVEEWIDKNKDKVIKNEKEKLKKIIENNEDKIVEYIIDVYEENVNTDKRYDIYLTLQDKNTFSIENVEEDGSYSNYGDWHIFTVETEKTEDMYNDDEEFISSMEKIYDIEIPAEIEEKTDKISYIKEKYAKKCAEEYSNLMHENYNYISKKIINEIKSNFKNL